ncbi:hypothetical protein AVEN_229573-1 [Araneus ventricosus]|uniref:Uncharacterized protein n=1 Tax=Araneus ventricosus TaxID=182803 RepID=A0A4Y2GHY4_ARAVE|nr:hypothetical protein AVEN_229573-1 [Araneus ventricosus]
MQICGRKSHQMSQTKFCSFWLLLPIIYPERYDRRMIVTLTSFLHLIVFSLFFTSAIVPRPTNKLSTAHMWVAAHRLGTAALNLVTPDMLDYRLDAVRVARGSHIEHL